MHIYPNLSLRIILIIFNYILIFLILETKSFKFGEIKKKTFFDNKRQLLNNLRFQDPIFKLVQPGQVIVWESQSNFAFFGKTMNGDLQLLGYENQNERNIIVDTENNVLKDKNKKKIEFIKIHYSIIVYKFIVFLEPYLPERIDNIKSLSLLKECFDEILGCRLLDLSLQ